MSELTLAGLAKRKAAATKIQAAPYAERAWTALANWEAHGAPIDVRMADPQVREAIGDDAVLAERMRAGLRAWATGPHDSEDVARNILGSVLAHTEFEWKRQADAARTAGMDGRRRVRQERRELIVADLKEMRKALGLSDAECDGLLGLRPGEFANSVSPSGSYAVERIEATATALRAHVKVLAAKANGAAS